METRSKSRDPKNHTTTNHIQTTPTQAIEEKLSASKKRRNRRKWIPLAKHQEIEEAQKLAEIEASKSLAASTEMGEKEADQSSKVDTVMMPANSAQPVSLCPTYTALVHECRRGEQEELDNHGKQHISQLHDKRRVKLILIDAIISHLDNQYQLKSSNEKDMEIEKRDILAGAMFLVQKQISGEYWVRSADNSLVHSNIKSALQAFDATGKNNALIAFARYFIENNLPANKDKPLEGYSINDIAAAIPSYQPAQPKKADEPKDKAKSGRRLFGFLSAAPSVPSEIEAKPTPTMTPRLS